MADISKGLIAGGLLLGGLLFFMRRSRGGRPVEDVQLSPHFLLSEFLHSTAVPEVALYHPTDTEIANARTLALGVLEPTRAMFGGPVVITGGGRPPSVRNAKGENFVQALREAGDQPAEHSDHEVFAGADFTLWNAPAREYLRIFNALKDLAAVRQVILYLTTDADGHYLPHHLHAAAVVPGRPRLGDAVRAFININGKRTDSGQLNV